MEAAGEPSCRELVELVTDYLEGAMPAGERQRFEEHLVFCPGCVYYLSQMATTRGLVGRLTGGPIPPEASAALLRAFRGWKDERGREAT